MTGPIASRRQKAVVGGQWPVVGGQSGCGLDWRGGLTFSVSPSPLPPVPSSPLPSPARRAFTLVELLASIGIIGILAGITLVAVQAAQQAARESATRATINKINHFIMARYESYKERRLPLTSTQMDQIAMARGWPLNDPTTRARVRLNALRDLMRMEMPDRWTDFILHPGNPTAVRPPLVLPQAPRIAERYREQYARAVIAAGPSRLAEVQQHAPAKCLYMIVMSDPDARGAFRENEVADVDNTGLRVFVDGWGRPIMFLRWPVGFVDYNRLAEHNRQQLTDPPQPPAGAPGGPPLPWSSPSDIQSGDPVGQPDFFDRAEVMKRLVTRPTDPLPPDRLGYAVFPLVYSAGRDGLYDIYLGDDSRPSPSDPPPPYMYEPALPGRDLNPFCHTLDVSPDASGATRRYVGQPMGSGTDDSLHHYDNITNHRMEAL